MTTEDEDTPPGFQLRAAQRIVREHHVRSVAPCGAAADGGVWGFEIHGGRADPRRARAIAALIEDLLVVDETDEKALTTLLGRHLRYGGGHHLAEVKELAQQTRRIAVAIHLAAGGVEESLRAVSSADLAIRTHKHTKKRKNMKARRLALLDIMHEIRQNGGISADLQRRMYELDPSSFWTMSSLPDLVPKLLKGTVTLAAAKLSSTLRMFGDDTRDLAKVRELYRQAPPKKPEKR